MLTLRDPHHLIPSPVHPPYLLPHPSTHTSSPPSLASYFPSSPHTPPPPFPHYLLTGLAVGVWSNTEELTAKWSVHQSWSPSMQEEQRKRWAPPACGHVCEVLRVCVGCFLCVGMENCTPYPQAPLLAPGVGVLTLPTRHAHCSHIISEERSHISARIGCTET